jgi:hypothetical protein
MRSLATITRQHYGSLDCDTVLHICGCFRVILHTSRALNLTCTMGT